MKPIEHVYSIEAVPAMVRDRLDAAEQWLERLDQHETFHGWKMIGEMLLGMQTEAMRQAGANRPIGKGYNAAWAVLAYRWKKLGNMDKATRSHAIWMAQHWAAVEEWHAGLPTERRRLVNHPATVHRQFDRDHPMPRKAGSPDAAQKAGFGPEDDDDDENGEHEEGEAYGIGDGGQPAPPPETREDWLGSVEAAWGEVIAVLRRAPREWRAMAVGRLVNALDELGDDEATADAIDDIDHEIGEHEAREVRTTAAAVVRTPRSHEPTPERLAQVVAEAEAAPLPDGADIFAGLGDDLGMGERITPERVRARRPKLSVSEATIIAGRLNFPDFDDAELAKFTKRAASTVRRVLDANGFKR